MSTSSKTVLLSHEDRHILEVALNGNVHRLKNLREFLNNFDLRNVTDDKALALEVAKARALLSGTSANTVISVVQPHSNPVLIGELPK